MSLSDLVRRIRSRDPDAEAEFVSRYRRGIAAILRHGCSPRMPIDDLCQDTLTLALQKIRAGEVRDPERLSGFVASLARNLAIQHGRRASWRREVADVDQAASRVEDPTDDPLQRLVREEQRLLVRRVLEELTTERDRQVLTRYYLDEQEKDEICAALGLTREHFTRVLFRARERYRELIDRHGVSERDERASRLT